MSYPYVLTERLNGAAIISLNRPEKLNALSFDRDRELLDPKGQRT